MICLLYFYLQSYLLYTILLKNERILHDLFRKKPFTRAMFHFRKNEIQAEKEEKSLLFG